MEFQRPQAGILIADNSPETVQAMQEHFVRKGIAVDVAADGATALAMLEKKKYDIAIIEVNLPGINGIELLREIKKQYPMVHCIMLTAEVTLGNVLSCIRHGADTCIFKPMKNLDELDRAVKKAQDSLSEWWSKLELLIKKRR
jgi:DNA-binding response OmpR family regulator